MNMNRSAFKHSSSLDPNAQARSPPLLNSPDEYEDGSHPSVFKVLNDVTDFKYDKSLCYKCPGRPIPNDTLLSFPYTYVMVSVDGSASTDNRAHQGSCRRCWDKQSCECHLKDVTKDTKIIILAQLEALATMFCEFMKEYDFTGTKLRIDSFSTKYVTCLKALITSNTELYDYLLKLDKIVKYERESTYLHDSLKTFFDDIELCSESPLIIIATDGQAFDQQKVTDLLKSKAKKFSLITIGAGSIGKSTQDRVTKCINQGRNTVIERTTTSDTLNNRNPETVSRSEYDYIKPEEKPIVQVNHSECDMAYLASLREYAIIGGYVGAFRDYEDVRRSAKEFIEIIKGVEQYAVILHDAKKGLLPFNVQSALFNGTCCYMENIYGKYIFTPKYQIRVEPNTTLPRYTEIDGTHYPIKFFPCTFKEQDYDWNEFRDREAVGRTVIKLKNKNISAVHKLKVTIQNDVRGFPRICSVYKDDSTI
jgi:hypothetical protein